MSHSDELQASVTDVVTDGSQRWVTIVAEMGHRGCHRVVERQLKCDRHLKCDRGG